VHKCMCPIAKEWRVFRLLIAVKDTRLRSKEISMTTIKSGDTVARDAATRNMGTVRLGEGAPAFIKSGDKVVRDAATQNQGTVRLGEGAPIFRTSK
jgi:hypothetical protein